MTGKTAAKIIARAIGRPARRMASHLCCAFHPTRAFPMRDRPASGIPLETRLAVPRPVSHPRLDLGVEGRFPFPTHRSRGDEWMYNRSRWKAKMEFQFGG